MINRTQSQFEVWAQLRVSEKTVAAVHKFFRDEYKISPEFLISNMHLTVYHSRRPMPKIDEVRKGCSFSIDTLDTRFMVLAPGGENTRKDIIPAFRKVGIRIKRGSTFRDRIYDYRKMFLLHETSQVLGLRKPSTKNRNAFGARYFQPHISLLRAGSGISNLTEVGENFRDTIREVHFDRFSIQTRRNF